MSLIVKLGKKGKRIVKKFITPVEKHTVGYTRRIERVKTSKRICAMTFDDGPMGMPASPDRFDGKPLTDVLLDTMKEYGARGSRIKPVKSAVLHGAASNLTIIRTFIAMTRAVQNTMTVSFAVFWKKVMRLPITATDI